MKYLESLNDRRLRNWFRGDLAHALLRRIVLKKGYLRGLTSLDIEFGYPISAIAGKNGAGKSTILAMACCAFHATSKGFKLPKRKNSYYTFSDFFIQQLSEQPLEGVEIAYTIAHNNWTKTPAFPDGKGLGNQVRKKKQAGKWNNYDTRVHRTVVFLGIERIVPHTERSQSKSYSRVFQDSAPKGWENKVMDAVGFVLGKNYSKFHYLEHFKYSLPFVTCEEVSYSGFNMGAGENALFDIFSTIYAAGEGAMLVIDEIELGLHAAAQRKFIQRLKEACLESKIQVICTTHSKEVFDCLPLDGRFYVEAVNGKTRVTPGISSEFAFSKMNEVSGSEIEIFIEDEVAKTIVQAALPASVRCRAVFTIIGSASAIARQLAALYMNRGQRNRPAVAIFDGDQLSNATANLNYAMGMAESTQPEFAGWYKGRVCHLPGETWPEKWLLQRASVTPIPVAGLLGCDPDDLQTVIAAGLNAGKHNEFHELSKHLGLDAKMCLQHFASAVAKACAAELQPVVVAVSDGLSASS